MLEAHVILRYYAVIAVQLIGQRTENTLLLQVAKKQKQQPINGHSIINYNL